MELIYSPSLATSLPTAGTMPLYYAQRLSQDSSREAVTVMFSFHKFPRDMSKMMLCRQEILESGVTRMHMDARDKSQQQTRQSTTSSTLRSAGNGHRCRCN